ncbi:MAG: putative caspase-like protein [Myxococcota bacterium]
MFALVVGVSDYAGNQLDLRFAAADAEAVSKALRAGALCLFGADRVTVRTLSTERSSAADMPTADAVRQALKQMSKQARASDVLLVYLAGHGVVASGEAREFYGLARGARSSRYSFWIPVTPVAPPSWPAARVVCPAIRPGRCSA